MFATVKITTMWAVAIAVTCLLVSVAADNNDLDAPAAKDSSRSGRDYSSYSSYFPDDDKGKYGGGYADYPPNTYVSYTKDETPANCPPSSLGPALNHGINFLVLKLGAIGIVKAFVAVLFFVFLLKLPILLAKAAFFKAIILPAIIAPLMMLFSNNNMMNMMMNGNKPAGGGGNGGNGANGGDGNGGDGSGRALYNLTETAWQSFRFILDADKCAERMACSVGLYNNDTISGDTLARMLKHIEYSSPVGSRGRLRSLRTAFTDGNSGGRCTDNEYPCEAPHLIVARADSQYTVV